MAFDNEIKQKCKELQSCKKNIILEQLIKLPQSKEEAQQVIAVIIKEVEIIKHLPEECTPINQGILNIAFRGYYNLLQKYELPDVHFKDLPTQLSSTQNSCTFNMLLSVLLIQRLEIFTPEDLKNKCITALHTALLHNQPIWSIIKCLNLLSARVPSLRLQVSLQDLYLCLQCKQQGMASELLKLSSQCCQTEQVASEYFGIITEHWPWTNRHKFTLLAVILKQHDLSKLLHTFERNEFEFLQGVRLSLNYKQLLAVSQDLVRVLLNQTLESFLKLCVSILSNGSLAEVHNFYDNWYKQFKDVQKQALFEKLQKLPAIWQLEGSRAVFIFKMFAKQSFNVCKLQFFKISTALITDCFQQDLDTQLYIYQFVVDNLSCFALEDMLDFIWAFVQQHKSIDNARFRNTVLLQLPCVFDCVAKALNKLHVGSTLGASIVQFFRQLQQQIETDIVNEEYQAQIFALKLLHTLQVSIYGQTLHRLTKQANLQLNEQLAQFLQQHEVYQVDKLKVLLLQQLSNPNGYDDAWELSVCLLNELQFEAIEETFERCREFCRNTKIDECALSQYFARVVVDSCLRKGEMEKCLSFYEETLGLLLVELQQFTVDPLLVCRGKNHLFGYINVLTEVIQAAQVKSYEKLLNCMEELVNVILNMLNLVNAGGNSAADFQDMDESLQILIEQSALQVDISEHTQTRKFLLLSFWYTLKSSCRVVLAVAQQIVKRNMQKNLLSKCFDVHMAILTRCRHKGAIESAGLSIGQLTNLTAKLMNYKLLEEQLDILFDDNKQVSTTRRGAGFSITLLHIVKQDAQSERPLLKYVMAKIFACLELRKNAANNLSNKNYDMIDALVLHYLCVLVKDAELRHALLPFYNEIMLAAIQQIDNKEWTVCNAALQLFGALVPKIVGQKQAILFDNAVEWEPAEVTYLEILHKMPKACQYILDYCGGSQSGTRSIILFLSFLANVEHLQLAVEMPHQETLLKFRTLLWQLLSHRCEQVRKLAANCFVRAHEIRCELPIALISICEILVDVSEENFFTGLVFTLKYGLAKLRYEAVHTLKSVELCQILEKINILMRREFKNFYNFKPYTLHIFMNLLKACDEKEQDREKCIEKIAASKTNQIGYDLCSLHLNEVII